MSFCDTKTLDRPTAILLSSLSIPVNSAVRMVWRRSYSGGDVLEDIGGRVVAGDGAAANNRPWAVQWGFITLTTAREGYVIVDDRTGEVAGGPGTKDWAYKTAEGWDEAEHMRIVPESKLPAPKKGKAAAKAAGVSSWGGGVR